MTDRALYLAKTIVSRLRVLETDILEGAFRDKDPDYYRQELVRKVLVVELGITDGAEIAMITAAAPGTVAKQELTKREIEEFAEFLRGHLGTRLEQS